ncbi:MAG TPA: hypothetical protein VF692_15660 [Pyrinomonadaceae bacterium]
MKKHLLGLAIFSFIFASVAFAFAFFSASQITQIAEVDEEINDRQPFGGYGRTSCFRNSRKNISVKVVNSQYIFDEDKIISEIKLVWNGTGTPPEKIYLTTLVSASENTSENSFGGVVQILEQPFDDAEENTFKVVSRGSHNKKVNKQNNLYVVAAASEFSDGETAQNNKNVSEAKEVVFVHGGSSIIGK